MGCFSHTFWLLCKRGVSCTHPILASLCGEFPYTSGAGFFRSEVFLLLTCPMLACLCWEFILHILCWLLDIGSFYYTSCAWCFMWGVSLTHPLLASLCGVSLTHPVLASLCGEFFLHLLCWLLCVGSFSYMYCVSFFMWRVSLAHPMLAALCGVFLLHILCWLCNVAV